MAQQITYSAKIKRDYVAASAVVIFIAIVLAEIALAISIPAYLKRENAMALEVRRLQLLDSFDGARGMSEKLKAARRRSWKPGWSPGDSTRLLPICGNTQAL